MITRFAIASIIIAALCFAVGCSKSMTTEASSGSSSDSSSSPFESSSKSSGSSAEDEKTDGEEAKETAYQRDIRNYTVEFAQSAGNFDFESFQRGLGAIAEFYGITDWEQTADTYVAVGRGLAESELDDSSAKQLAVELSNEDYDRLALVRSGYENRRNQ